MSHAIRNTLILLVVLILFVATGWIYVSYVQTPKIKKLQTQVDKKHTELKRDEEIAAQYSAIEETFQEASKYFKNFDKALYGSSNEDDVYDFLNSVNRDQAFNNFNFAFTDSLTHPKYGMLKMEITGDGKYRNVVNFIREIELSKPLNKVKKLSITPIDEDEKYGDVNYSFDLESFYDRSKILGNPSMAIYNKTYASVNNPFFPLIRSNLKPNTAGRVDISKSRLVALSTERVFLIDQNGVMQQITIGGKVYLGKLSSINLNNRSATFTLNEGGITENITLKVNHENK